MPGKKTNNTSRITIHNKINQGFRQIHIDGALGGITPKGLINLNFFAERFPIPKSTDFEIDKETKTLKRIEDSNDTKEGIIREYEFGVYMNIETAKNILSWLQIKVDEYNNLIKEQSDDSP
jgi:hypothetical protein